MASQTSTVSAVWVMQSSTHWESDSDWACTEIAVARAEATRRSFIVLEFVKGVGEEFEMESFGLKNLFF